MCRKSRNIGSGYQYSRHFLYYLIVASVQTAASISFAKAGSSGLAAVLFNAIRMLLFLPILSEYFKTGLVPRFPTMIVITSLMVISILLYITRIILAVIEKKHKQLFELYMLNLNIK